MTPELRKSLNQQLFLASRKNCMTPDDGEEVRVVRGAAVAAVTEITRSGNPTDNYKDLVQAELNWAVRLLNQGSHILRYIKPMPELVGNTRFASRKEQLKIHFLLLKIGVRYCPVDGVVIGGQSGEQLREELVRRFALGRLDGAYSSHVYKNWAIQIVRRWLTEGGYKCKAFRGEKFVNWSELTRDEAEHLIVRLVKMDSEVVERYPAFSRVGVPEVVLN